MKPVPMGWACGRMRLANVESPIEWDLGLALFERLYGLYEHWTCRINSDDGFRADNRLRALRADDEEGPPGEEVIELVSQFRIPAVGRVDFAIFIPDFDYEWPLVVVECDGHDFHERTTQQASRDRQRDRRLAFRGIHCLRYTGSDIFRWAGVVASEIAEFVDRRANAKEREWFANRGMDPDMASRLHREIVRDPESAVRTGVALNEVPYLFPRIRPASA
jgi:very-short-patch-repair endonuclease